VSNCCSVTSFAVLYNIDITDEELVSATQAFQSSYIALFSDISDEEFRAAIQLLESSLLSDAVSV